MQQQLIHFKATRSSSFWWGSIVFVLFMQLSLLLILIFGHGFVLSFDKLSFSGIFDLYCSKSYTYFWPQQVTTLKCYEQQRTHFTLERDLSVMFKKAFS